MNRQVRYTPYTNKTSGAFDVALTKEFAISVFNDLSSSIVINDTLGIGVDGNTLLIYTSTKKMKPRIEAHIRKNYPELIAVVKYIGKIRAIAG